MLASGDRLARLLAPGLVVVALVACVTFPVSAAYRLAYPFELEWLESEMLQHVSRVLSGQPLYAAPSADFAPTIYPPLFAWMGALVASAVGHGFLAPRLVSVLATLTTAAIAGLAATRIGGDRRGGLIAVGLVLASYVPCGTFYDLARVDPLWTALLVAGTALAAGARTAGRAGIAGLMFALASVTKQPAGLFAIAAAAVLWWTSRRLALVLVGAWLGIALTTYAALHLASNGWSSVYTILIPFLVPHPPGKLLYFVRDDLLRGYAPAITVALAWALTPRGRRPGGPLPAAWALGLAAALVATTSMRTIQGGGPNTLMTLVVYGAVVVGAIAGRVLSGAPASTRRLLEAALLVQFGGLIYNPLAQVPDAAERARAETFLARVAAIPGDVWIPSHTSFAHLAGKPFLVHRDPLLDLTYSGWDAFPHDLETRLRAGVFAAVIVDGPFVEHRIQAALDDGYEPVEELTDGPELRVGYRTRPRTVYRPRRRADNALRGATPTRPRPQLPM